MTQAVDVSGDEGKPTTSSTAWCQEVTSQADIGAVVLGAGDGGKLQKLLDALPSISAREECIRVLRLVFLWAPCPPSQQGRSASEF